MNIADLNSFAYVAADALPGEIKAVCLTFPGLNGIEMKSFLDYGDTKLAQLGILFVFPFVNPWNWMNDRTVKFVDEVMDAVIAKYRLGKDCPLILRGGSMGGYSVLAYAMFSRYRPAAVFANCPVTDIYFHRTERPDLPRTINDAMGDYGDISEVLQERSPNYHPEKLPDCRYLIVHGFNDKSVNKAAHSDKLVAQMKARGMTVTYVEDGKMAHCNPMSYETIVAIDKFFDDAVK